jgi:hypothetical protein
MEDDPKWSEWTAISYNWSAAIVGIYVFAGENTIAHAVRTFSLKYPGENLLALIPGDNSEGALAYQLTLPSTITKFKKGKEES